MPRHLLHPPPVKQVSVVQPPQSNLTIPLNRMHLQVIWGPQLSANQRFYLQSLQLLRTHRRILQCKHYLKHRRPAQTPLLAAQTVPPDAGMPPTPSVAPPPITLENSPLASP